MKNTDENFLMNQMLATPGREKKGGREEEE
jgi:hypothetical protein